MNYADISTASYQAYALTQRTGGLVARRGALFFRYHRDGTALDGWPKFVIE
jgi:hypothetical protein